MIQPCSLMIDVPQFQAWPRSVPLRSQQTIATWLPWAAAMAIVISGGRSPAGTDSSGQLVGITISSAPRSARLRVISGNSRS
jgi:hypothetical protein